MNACVSTILLAIQGCVVMVKLTDQLVVASTNLHSLEVSANLHFLVSGGECKFAIFLEMSTISHLLEMHFL